MMQWAAVTALCLQDVAIAHGYNNLRWTVPQTVTIGSEVPLNQMTELLRLECAMAGFTEILTWALCSHAENFSHLQHSDDGTSAVSISNPATAEFEVCRTSLLPGAPDTSVASLCSISPIIVSSLSHEARNPTQYSSVKYMAGTWLTSHKHRFQKLLPYMQKG